jgi:hypothetical protein
MHRVYFCHGLVRAKITKSISINELERNEGKKLTTVNRFRKELAPILKAVSEQHLPTGKCFKELRHQGKYLSFPNAVVFEYNRAIRLLREKANKNNKAFSEKAIEHIFDNFLFELVYKQERSKTANEIEKHIKSLFKEIYQMKSEKRFGVVPIMCLGLSRNIRIGDCVIVDKNNSDLSIPEANSVINTGFRLMGSKSAQYLFTENQTYTFCITEVEASDDEKAEELALSKTELCLNVLRLFWSDATFVARDDYKQFILRNIILVNKDEKGGSHHFRALNEKARDTTYLTKDDLDRLIIPLQRVNKFLGCTSARTPLQKNLLTSIFWFGNAVKEDQRIMKFLKCIMALEALLLPDGGKGKSRNIAKRFASVANANGTDSDKINAYRTMKELYEIRSRILHGGEAYVYEDDLAQAMSWVQGTIQIVLKHSENFGTLKELIEKEYPIKGSIYQD